MSPKKNPEAENRGTQYEPWERPDHYAQNAGLKPPRKKDRERDPDDNKTS